jgi:hypothetical protein
MEGGVWKTVGGRRIFIKDGQELASAMKESGKFPKASISVTVKGQAAIDKLLAEKQGRIKGAFHRDDIGDIDLLWGNEKLGLAHIIKQRQSQGINIKDFLSNISEVVEKGRLRGVNSKGNYEILYAGKMAIVSPQLDGNKTTFLLTAYKTRYK